MFYSMDEIDRLISEDMPYFDLTTTLLEVQKSSKIYFLSRNETTLSGNTLVKALSERLGLKVVNYKKDSQNIAAYKKIFEAYGDSRSIHILWKIAQNIYTYACGVATYTNKMVKIAKAVNPNIEILTTRKIIPFTKKIALNAVLDGGGFPHRISASETILVFNNHITLLGGWKKFVKDFSKLKLKAVEKKWIVETSDKKIAKKLIKKGVDILQFERGSIEDIKKIVDFAKDSNTKIIATGGIDINNVEKYAKCGVSAIATTAAYFAKNADIKVVIEKI
jgi:molybdenum transport protein